jgi:hypothetical protein
MKLYKSPSNDIYAYELDGSQDHLIPNNFIALTQTEIEAREALFVEEKAKAQAKKQAALDAKQSALNKLMALGLTEAEALALGVK